MPGTSINGEQPIALPAHFTYAHINRSNNDDSSSSSSATQQATKKLKNAKDQSSNEEDMDTDVEEEMHAEDAINNASPESDEQQNDGFTIKKSRRQRQRTSSETQEGHPTADGRRPQQAPKHTLAAIKLQISNAVADIYSSTVAIAKEIDRCMGGKLNIKFASLKGNLLIIATDDAASHAKLSADWPADAFTKGVKPLVKPFKDAPRVIIIKGVESSIAMDDDYVLSQLRDQHALSPVRIINKKTGQPTSLVKVTVANASALKKILDNGIRIGYRAYRTETERKVLQCFKCQGIGHSAFHCPKAQACLKCAGEHTHKDCTAVELKCANCGGAHAACSRQCPKLKTQPTSKPPALPLAKPAVTPKVTNQPPKVSSLFSGPPPQRTGPVLSNELQDFIMRVVQSKLNELMTSLQEQIKVAVTDAISSLLPKQFEPQLLSLASALGSCPPRAQQPNTTQHNTTAQQQPNHV